MLNSDLREEVKRELIRVRAPTRVARNLGLDIRDVLSIADEMVGRPRVLREEQFGGKGRPELSEYFVARKKAWEAWDNAIPEIAAARAAFEEGTHNMVTGRDGDWLILYSLPQRRLTPRVDYFQPGFVS